MTPEQKAALRLFGTMFYSAMFGVAVAIGAVAAVHQLWWLLGLGAGFAIFTAIGAMRGGEWK